MRRFFCSVLGNSAVIDQFVRQIERDPPNGSLFSDLLWWRGLGQLSCIPRRRTRLDGRMDVSGGCCRWKVWREEEDRSLYNV